MSAMKLTAGEQDFLADVCELLRGIRRDMDLDAPINGGDLVEDLCCLLGHYGWTTQQLDELCERLQRTGANA